MTAYLLTKIALKLKNKKTFWFQKKENTRLFFSIFTLTRVVSSRASTPVPFLITQNTDRVNIPIFLQGIFLFIPWLWKGYDISIRLTGGPTPTPTPPSNRPFPPPHTHTHTHAHTHMHARAHQVYSLRWSTFISRFQSVSDKSRI